MRFVDNSTLDPPPRWKRRANQLKIQVKALPPQERADFINNHTIWRELRPLLEMLSHCKCWYCERKWVREDPHVDHFRPKNRIKNKDGSQEEGYWWLAYEQSNYRLACSYCNCPHTDSDGITRGKAEIFPLDERSRRATENSDIADELPILLDPTKRSDPTFIWFLDTGEVTPKETRGLPQRRAVETVFILNLNDIRLVEARRILWNRCLSLMRRADVAFKKYDELNSVSAYSDYEQAIAEMCELVRPESEFSMTARACFQKSAYEFVNST